MRNLSKVLLTLIATVSLVTSCIKLHEDENHHYKIYFKNNWDKSVTIWYAIDRYWNDNPFDKDTPFFYEKPIQETEWYDKIPSGCTVEFLERRSYYETDLEDGDTIVVCVFDAENPEKKDTECFLVRYYLSKEDLRKINFHVSFPPTETMRTFYMKPPFDQVDHDHGAGSSDHSNGRSGKIALSRCRFF